MRPPPINNEPVDPDERHDPRCRVRPCTCAVIARRVLADDAELARRIREQQQLFDTQQMVPIGLCPFPHEWTDQELQRLQREMDPQDDVTVAMRKVYAWRQ